jgi:hypothetical protein
VVAGTAALALASAGCGAVTPPSRAVLPGDATAVHVHLASPVPATLVATDASGLSSVACTSPCDRALDTTGRTFTLEAPGHASSPTFLIPAARRGMVLRFDPSETGQTLGIGLLIVPGAAAATMGATLIMLDQSGREDFAGTTTAGAIIAGVGASFIVSGVVVWALLDSDVTLEEATKRAARGIPLAF